MNVGAKRQGLARWWQVLGKGAQPETMTPAERARKVSFQLECLATSQSMASRGVVVSCRYMLKHGMSRNAGVSRLLSHCFGSYRETRQAAALQPTKQVRRLETTVADLRKQLDKEALLRESLRADLQVPFVF
eukprot:SAG25_NODE_1373_length_3177_cov_2.176088_7_plen_132_part_00